MKFNYDLEINNILNNIYKKKLFSLAYKNNISNIDSENLNIYKNKFKSFDVYLGNEIEDMISDLLPKEIEGYLFRCEVSKHKNNHYPKLYDNYGNKLENIGDNRFAALLWEEHINNLIIADIYKLFNKNNLHYYIDNNLDNIYKEINNHVIESKNSSKITISFTNKSELTSIVKDMLLKNELNISFAHELVDLEKIREEMIMYAASLDMYNEYDKLEDELEYCLNKFFKFNNDELLDFLVNNHDFEFVENIGLIK